jgi:uncharacterized damage-inducible protein DinB
MNIRELLIDTYTYIPPRRALEQLSPAGAERRAGQGTHTAAEIVAHLSFWQDWFCARCEGTGLPMVSQAIDGWPVVAPGSWTEIRDGFLAGLERAATIGADEAALARPVTPPIEFPPLAGYTVRDALVHLSQHNAHHLGQVILLRQVIGEWPPPSGSWTW